MKETRDQVGLEHSWIIIAPLNSLRCKNIIINFHFERFIINSETFKVTKVGNTAETEVSVKKGCSHLICCYGVP